jgi:protein-L-isoaspartate(D-aspartate) O-methyltransferase
MLCLKEFDRRLGAIVCPSCRDRDYREISAIKKNIALLQSMEGKREVPRTPCSNHSSQEAMFLCMDDRQHLCIRCVPLHKQHDFFTVDDPTVTAGTDKVLTSVRHALENSLKAALSCRESGVRTLEIVKRRRDEASSVTSAALQPLLAILEELGRELTRSMQEPCNGLTSAIKSRMAVLDSTIHKRQKQVADFEVLTQQVNKVVGADRLALAEEAKSLLSEEELPSFDDLKTEAEGIKYELSLQTDRVAESLRALGCDFTKPTDTHYSEDWVLPELQLVEPRQERQVALIASLVSSGLDMSARIIGVLESIDRAEFMPAECDPYADNPQRIGFNTTISAPHMHGLTLIMLESKLQPGIKVLDVGCGSGYLTLCLAKMIGRGLVIGLDHIEELVNQASWNICKSHSQFVENEGISVRFVVGDGRLGCPDVGPYDVIHIGAATPEVPQPLLDQLAPGGILMAPVGPINTYQRIMIFSKDAQGRVSSVETTSVSYAPLTDRSRQCP